MNSEKKVIEKVKKIEGDISQLEKKIVIKSIIPVMLIFIIIVLILYLIFLTIDYLLPKDILEFTRVFLCLLGPFVSLGFIVPFFFDNDKVSFFAPSLNILKKDLERIKKKKVNEENKLELYNQIKNEYWQNLKGVDLEVATQNLFSRYLKIKLYLTSTTGDGGIDIHGNEIVFQCKGNTSKIGEPAIRDFYGAASSLGIKSHRSIFVAPSGFTASAMKFAKYKMKLVDAEILSGLAKSELNKIKKK